MFHHLYERSMAFPAFGGTARWRGQAHLRCDRKWESCGPSPSMSVLSYHTRWMLQHVQETMSIKLILWDSHVNAYLSLNRPDIASVLPPSYLMIETDYADAAASIEIFCHSLIGIAISRQFVFDVEGYLDIMRECLKHQHKCPFRFLNNWVGNFGRWLFH